MGQGQVPRPFCRGNLPTMHGHILAESRSTRRWCTTTIAYAPQRSPRLVTGHVDTPLVGEDHHRVLPPEVRRVVLGDEIPTQLDGKCCELAVKWCEAFPQAMSHMYVVLHCAVVAVLPDAVGEDHHRVLPPCARRMVPDEEPRLGGSIKGYEPQAQNIKPFSVVATSCV